MQPLQSCARKFQKPQYAVLLQCQEYLTALLQTVAHEKFTFCPSVVALPIGRCPTPIHSISLKVLFNVHDNSSIIYQLSYLFHFFCFVLTFKTILVHNMFCRCCELLKKIYLYLSIFTNTKTTSSYRVSHIKVWEIILLWWGYTFGFFLIHTRSAMCS